jgi:hypothetical protein
MTLSRESLVVLMLLGAARVVHADDSKPVPDAELKAWVDSKVDERQPSAVDRRFDEIGWFTDVRTAEKAGRESGRPLFLFTHDGRMSIGRC